MQEMAEMVSLSWNGISIFWNVWTGAGDDKKSVKSVAHRSSLILNVIGISITPGGVAMYDGFPKNNRPNKENKNNQYVKLMYSQTLSFIIIVLVDYWKFWCFNWYNVLKTLINFRFDLNISTILVSFHCIKWFKVKHTQKYFWLLRCV